MGWRVKIPIYGHYIQERLSKLLHKAIKHLKQMWNMGLRFQELDIATVQIVTYSYASFNNALENKSQFGSIILLIHHSKQCLFIQFSKHQSPRVVSSTCAAQTLAFSDTLDNFFFVKHDLQKILYRQSRSSCGQIRRSYLMLSLEINTSQSQDLW